MGTTISITETVPELSPEQRDIKYLGSNYPFGDAELVKLYRAFHEIRESKDSVSFLTDLAVRCSRPKPEEINQEDSASKLEQLQKERLMLMQVVENRILPPGFSDKLEAVAFRLAGDRMGAGVSPSTDDETDGSRMARAESLRRDRVDKFFEGISNISRRGARRAMGVLFDCCLEDESQLSGGNEHSDENVVVADVRKILDLGYRLSLATAFLEAAGDDDDMGQWIPAKNIDDSALEALGKSIVNFARQKSLKQKILASSDGRSNHERDGFVEKIDLQEWAEYLAPLLPSAMATFMHLVLFPEKPHPPSRTAFDFPKPQGESTFFSSAASPLLFSFACLSRSLGGTWFRLYTSASDGLSFNRLQNALLGYDGPTLLIIQATNGGVFGAFTSSAWKESKDFYGNSDCFLYQLFPTTAVYRPSGNGSNFMYCNSRARSKGYDRQAHGIGFGGTVEMPRLFIAESFDGCVARSQDPTFEGGPLLPLTKSGGLQKNFEIDCLEVWGVGGEEVVAEALGARNRQREIQAANIRKARKVDKAAFLDDFRSGLIESKAFKYRDEIRGRADAAVDDRHKNAYVYEK